MGVREDLQELQSQANQTAPGLLANARDALKRGDKGRYKGAVDGITQLYANAYALQAQISAAQPPGATLEAARNCVGKIARIKDQILGLDRGTVPSTRQPSTPSTGAPSTGSPSTTEATAPLSTGKKVALGALFVGLAGGAVAVARKMWGK